jgi:DNA-binding PadR family transcriptional regulator
VLELAILGLLKEQELHGYELKKRLVDTLGPLSRVSFGSLYPALARLQAAGALQTAETRPLSHPATPVIPMTGSIAGEAAAFRLGRGSSRRTEPRSSRTRKVYRITPRGEALFAELLATESSSVEDDRAFNLKLAFCRYLPPEARLGLLERRRAHLVERLAKARSTLRTRRERMDAYMRSLVDHDTEAAERDISWLDALIASERKGLWTDQADNQQTGPDESTPSLPLGTGLPNQGAPAPPGRRHSS